MQGWVKEEIEIMNTHTNYLRDLALNIILLEDEDVNKSLFEYIQFIGDFELLGEITALSMRNKESADL